MTDFCCLFVCWLFGGLDDLCLLDYSINLCGTSHVHVQNSFKITILRAYLHLGKVTALCTCMWINLVNYYTAINVFFVFFMVFCLLKIWASRQQPQKKKENFNTIYLFYFVLTCTRFTISCKSSHTGTIIRPLCVLTVGIGVTDPNNNTALVHILK